MRRLYEYARKCNTQFTTSKSLRTLYRSSMEIYSHGAKEKQKPILIRIKATAWRFNQLDYCVLPREAVYWSFTVPREIP